MRRAAAEVVALAAPAPRLGEVLDFLRLIWALHHALHKSSKRMRARIGVTGPQRLVIRIVARFPGITAGQIAELLHVHPSTLTGVLKRLQQRGLIRRRADPRDGRRAFLGVTESGRAIDADATGTVEAAVQELLARTPRERVKAARQVLIELASTLDGAD